MNNVAEIGHNNPPTPLEVLQTRIMDLHDEATGFLDGEPIDNQGLADAVSELMVMLRDAKKEAEALRDEEYKPFNDGKAEVMARFDPLIADKKSGRGKAVLAIEACKKALTPWHEKLDREKREVEMEARRVAEEKERAAQEAIRTAKKDDLAARENAEALIKDAKIAEATANRAAKDTAKTSGGSGRSVSMRTTYEPVLSDSWEALKHYWNVDRTGLEAWALERAKKDVRGGTRTIPGFTINEVKTVA